MWISSWKLIYNLFMGVMAPFDRMSSFEEVLRVFVGEPISELWEPIGFSMVSFG
uniref:Uncharacterized protein n=1 Tax=Manihot esculenta TaxID=3983 RepID=A0A2C9VS74_MANES